MQELTKEATLNQDDDHDAEESGESGGGQSPATLKAGNQKFKISLEFGQHCCLKLFQTFLDEKRP